MPLLIFGQARADTGDQVDGVDPPYLFLLMIALRIVFWCILQDVTSFPLNSATQIHHTRSADLLLSYRIHLYAGWELGQQVPGKPIIIRHCHTYITISTSWGRESHTHHNIFFLVAHWYRTNKKLMKKGSIVIMIVPEHSLMLPCHSMH